MSEAKGACFQPVVRSAARGANAVPGILAVHLDPCKGVSGEAGLARCKRKGVLSVHRHKPANHWELIPLHITQFKLGRSPTDPGLGAARTPYRRYLMIGEKQTFARLLNSYVLCGTE